MRQRYGVPVYRLPARLCAGNPEQSRQILAFGSRLQDRTLGGQGLQCLLLRSGLVPRFSLLDVFFPADWRMVISAFIQSSF